MRTSVVSSAITALLEEEPNLALAEIVEKLLAKGISTVRGIQSSVSTQYSHGELARTGTPGHYRYRAREESQVVVHAPFSAAAQFSGERLDPMDWSMRHLLGA